MKRLFLFIFTSVFFLSALFGCARDSTQVDSSGKSCLFVCPPGEAEDDSDNEAVIDTPIKVIRYAPDGWGTVFKTIPPCRLSTMIINGISAADETGEVSEKLSDGEIIEGSCILPAEPGTIWIEVNSDVYRVSPDRDELWRVEGHLGAGRKLEASDELMRSISAAWFYYPYNFFSGHYDNASGKLEMKNSYSAASSVEIRIKRIKIQKSSNPKNRIVLELISPVDQTLEIKLNCQQSLDNLALGDSKQVELQANKPKKVELGFGGWKDFSYWITITADNTRLSITINP
ncbi:MAG: hypothetical protein IKI64_09400 [Clostridia bacterium]|nr:hypothetical protein [Clostridia bacterium]